jgi:hypothetical protein
MAAIAYKVALSAGNVGRYRLLTVKTGQIIGFTFIIELFPANATSAFVGVFFDHFNLSGAIFTLLTKKCQKCSYDPSI